MTAGAMHRDGVIVGVNTGFHETPFCRVRSARLSDQGPVGSDRGQETTAASLGREAILNHTRRVKIFQMGDTKRLLRARFLESATG